MIGRTTKLRDLAELHAGMPTTRGKLRDAAGGTAVLAVRALRDGWIDRDELLYLDAQVEAPRKYRARHRDVLIPARSTSLKTALVSTDFEGALFNATLISIRCNEDELSPELLAAYLNHPEGRAQVEAASQSGTHQMNVTVSALGAIEIPVPPVEQQRKLVAALTQANEAYRHGVAAAEKRRRLMHDIVIRSMGGRQVA